MTCGPIIRKAQAGDFGAVRDLLVEAFDGPAEANLVEGLRSDGDVVLELVATHHGAVIGAALFSRLKVENGDDKFNAVALAPLAVASKSRSSGIGQSLVESAHRVLAETGETLSLVLGDPAYYGRFGYDADRASKFASAYQGPYLQALFWGDAPDTGQLVYAPAFSRL